MEELGTGLIQTNNRLLAVTAVVANLTDFTEQLQKDLAKLSNLVEEEFGIIRTVLSHLEEDLSVLAETTIVRDWLLAYRAEWQSVREVTAHALKAAADAYGGTLSTSVISPAQLQKNLASLEHLYYKQTGEAISFGSDDPIFLH